MVKVCYGQTLLREAPGKGGSCCSCSNMARLGGVVVGTRVVDDVRQRLRRPKVERN